jgi:hypothetical protein
VPVLRGAGLHAAPDYGPALQFAPRACPFCVQSNFLLDLEPPVAQSSVPLPVTCSTLQERLFYQRSRAGTIPPPTGASSTYSSTFFALSLLTDLSVIIEPRRENYLRTHDISRSLFILHPEEDRSITSQLFTFSLLNFSPNLTVLVVLRRVSTSMF